VRLAALCASTAGVPARRGAMPRLSHRPYLSGGSPFAGSNYAIRSAPNGPRRSTSWEQDLPCPIGSSALDVRASPFMSKTPCQRVSTATDCRPCPNLDQTFAAIDAHEDQMVKVLTAEGRGDGLPVGPVYFSKDYVRRGFLCKDIEIPAGAPPRHSTCT
jgi:hypothetical protein